MLFLVLGKVENESFEFLLAGDRIFDECPAFPDPPLLAAFCDDTVRERVLALLFEPFGNPVLNVVTILRVDDLLCEGHVVF